VGFKIWLSVYAFNLPPPAVCALVTLRSHEARFGIQSRLAMGSFISFKNVPALYRTRISGQPIICPNRVVSRPILEFPFRADLVFNAPLYFSNHEQTDTRNQKPQCRR